MELNNVTESQNIIERVVKDSIAEELELEIGDIILAIDDMEVKDIIDYKYLISDDYIVMDVLKKDGEVWQYEIEKEFDEDLGIEFTNPLIDRAKSCQNKCVFCFIDQLPKGMRKTLYFKDDDSRLSFLQGNFITLTNMRDDEIDRIIKYRLSPINISIHTTNPELRREMLFNKNAGKAYEILKRFHEANLEVNCQIVVVPGYNDGEELKRTITDLAALHPTVKSVAAVPVGITKFRENLPELKTFDGEMAGKLIDEIKIIQDQLLEERGSRFIFLSDEFYALSKRPIPEYEEYEGFPQLENGVGLMKSFEAEVDYELNKLDEEKKLEGKYIIATGTLAADYMTEIAKKVMEKFDKLEIEVVPIINNFFGETITVAGLITGQDLIDQLKGSKADAIMIPRAMMKADEEIFLDDITLEELRDELEIEVIVSEVDGNDFINKFKEVS